MSKPVCLFICTHSPLNTEIKSGGAMLSRANYSVLLGKYTVVILSTLGNKQGLLRKLLRVLFLVLGYLGGNNPIFEKKIKHALVTLSPNLVFIDHSQLGRLAGKIKTNWSHLLNSTQPIVITSFHNIEADYFKNSSPFPWPLSFLLGRVAHSNEHLAVQFSNYLCALTKDDSQIMKRRYGREADIIVPITLASTTKAQNVESSPHPKPYLLFCGSNFPPNREAVKWFVDFVLEHIPYDLLVIGFQMEELSGQISHSKLRIIGTVEDVSQYYLFAEAIVNPVTKGAGMNTKSVEAAKYGRKLLTTPFALKGFPEPLPEGIYICHSKEDFIQFLKNLNESPREQSALTNYFEQYFSLKGRATALYSLLSLYEGKSRI